ncbi:MAG: hypothetical protein H7A35_09440 [Planctomycetales bacterium]|nr:hypothetical protein [bacterium]UNM07101.1 MAG: hypothetical protein H7A35_09440 [Planctomycetales bacterium]
MLEHIDRRLAQFSNPIREFVYTRDEGACNQVLDDAWRWLSQQKLSTDEMQAMKMVLHFLEFQVSDAFTTDKDKRRQQILYVLRSLSEPIIDPTSSVMQARILLTLRCWAHRSYDVRLSLKQFEQWFNMIPESDVDSKCWNYISFWAFDTRADDYLKAAYRYFLTSPVDFAVDFSRQRLKVMVGLIEGTCKVKDVERLIELMPHYYHIRWFMRNIVPFCKSLQLWTPALEGAFSAKSRELMDSPQVPPRTVPQGRKILNF